MSIQRNIRLIAIISGLLLSPVAHAFFFILPIPNLAKPAPLNTIIDALEKSDETKAVAYASEDKTFGSKTWVWGHYSGHVTQAEADRIALSRCQSSLANAKAQKAGGKELYDFGTKVCELHNFENKTVSRYVTEQQEQRPAPIIPVTPSEPVAPMRYEPQATEPRQESTPVNIISPSAVATPAVLASEPTPPTVKRQEGQTAPALTVSNPPTQLPTGAPQEQRNETKPPREENQTARKLRELNELRKEGLITEREFNEKRKAILSAM